jgi:hypothetical protein
MDLEKLENKNLIFESLWESLRFPFISILLISFVLVSDIRISSPTLFWNTLILFGGSFSYFFIRFINPKNIFVRPNSELDKAYREQEFNKRYNDIGIFSYHDKGFTINIGNEENQYNWTQIETIVAYKEDLYTTDMICMNLLTNDNLKYSLNEETKGWFQFVKNSKKNISEISKDWDFKIMTPVFETSLTLLYDRRKRTLEEISKDS